VHSCGRSRSSRGCRSTRSWMRRECGGGMGRLLIQYGHWVILYSDEESTMIKRLELSNPKSCLNKAKPDEPVFVLKATDLKAPMAIRHWATMSEGTQSEKKLAEALALA